MNYNNYNNTYTGHDNTIIKNLYAPGYSFLRLSFYRTNMALSFSPFSGKNNVGRSQYDTKNFINTTIDNESAAALYSVTMSILNGSKTPVQLVIPCNHGASLMFKYEPDQNQNNEMRAYLIIEKGNKSIPFQFELHFYSSKENGQIVTKTIQSGLIVFAKTLEIYLMRTDSEKYQNKFSEGDTGASQIQITNWQP